MPMAGRFHRFARAALLAAAGAMAASATFIPIGLLASTGLGMNGPSQLPLQTFPSTEFSAGSCVVHATSFVALASGTATRLAFSLLGSLGDPVQGLLLAVYPDDGADAPGPVPIFDALLSGVMLDTVPEGGADRTLHRFPTAATWSEYGTVTVDLSSGRYGCKGIANPADCPAGGYAAWNAHHGRGGIELVAGSKYWVAFSLTGSQSSAVFVQADATGGLGRGSWAPGSAGVKKAVLTASASCPDTINTATRSFNTFPVPDGGVALTWAASAAVGTGLAINFCTVDTGAAACLDMPGSFGPNMRLLHANKMVAPQAGQQPIAASRGRMLAAQDTGSWGQWSAVTGLLGSSGTSWDAPGAIPVASFQSSCTTLATPIRVLANGTVTAVTMSVSVSMPSTPWVDWRDSASTPYPPGLVLSVFGDAAGSPGTLLWSQALPWNALVPIDQPTRTPGAAFWREFNTFSVDLGSLAPSLALTLGDIVWVAIAGLGDRGDESSGNDWEFQQADARLLALLPGGYVPRYAVLSADTACAALTFPASAQGNVTWTAAPHVGVATGGLAVSLCTSATSSRCAALQSPPIRVLANDVTPATSAVLVSTGIAPGSNNNAITLPAAYAASGCKLLATPVLVRTSGQLDAIVFSASVAGAAPAGALIGVHMDDNGTPGEAIWAAYADASALKPVDLPRSGDIALDDWRLHNTLRVSLADSDRGTDSTSPNPAGSLIVMHGGPDVFLSSGSVVWISFAATGAAAATSLAGDVQVQEAAPWAAAYFQGNAPLYTVRTAAVAASRTCGITFPAADEAGAPLAWVPDTSVTAAGMAFQLCTTGTPCLSVPLAPSPTATPTMTATPSATVTPAVAALQPAVAVALALQRPFGGTANYDVSSLSNASLAIICDLARAASVPADSVRIVSASLVTAGGVSTPVDTSPQAFLANAATQATCDALYASLNGSSVSGRRRLAQESHRIVSAEQRRAAELGAPQTAAAALAGVHGASFDARPRSLAANLTQTTTAANLTLKMFLESVAARASVPIGQDAVQQIAARIADALATSAVANTTAFFLFIQTWSAITGSPPSAWLGTGMLTPSSILTFLAAPGTFGSDTYTTAVLAGVVAGILGICIIGSLLCFALANPPLYHHGHEWPHTQLFKLGNEARHAASQELARALPTTGRYTKQHDEKALKQL